jgi:hypothetical protein
LLRAAVALFVLREQSLLAEEDVIESDGAGGLRSLYQCTADALIDQTCEPRLAQVGLGAAAPTSAASSVSLRRAAPAVVS